MKNNNLTIDKARNKKIIKINPVKNRFLPLSESVIKGLEPEPTIKDFKIQKEIGNGSFGRVFLATHLKTNVDYAIKIIDKRNKTNIEGKPYFRREIEIMYKIRHPNCVRLFGNFEDENYCYFIMEYIPGGNLFSLMRENRNTGLNIYLVASIMRQLISAIYYLHNMNPSIIHRDIKPENVLLVDNMKVKLTDFGWSNYINYEGEQRSTFCGTPIYLSPEMIQNIGHDEHVDIWCLGILLFELLTGTPPFIGQNRVLLMNNIINVNITWPSQTSIPIDADAKDLILKILKKKPFERISLENMVKHNFFIKYCPNVKPILDKRQKYHLKPFIISKDIPNNDDDYYDNENNDNNDNIEFSQRRLIRTSNKKNKLRDITPSPKESKLTLEKKSKSNVNDINNINTGNNILIRQNTKDELRTYDIATKLNSPKNNNQYDTIKVLNKLKGLMKENQKLEKENENYKLREIGYNKKIEELTFALNNLNQENMLLKLDLENQKKDLEKCKKELEKRKKEINILRSRRNVNLNLNNQTTYNINTSDRNRDRDRDRDMDRDGRSSNYKELKSNKNTSRKKTSTNNKNIKSIMSKTPEGLQHKGRRIIINNSIMKPYLKKNITLVKCNKSLNKDEENNNSNSNDISNIMNKKESEAANILRLNKNVSYDDFANIKEKKNIINNNNSKIVNEKKYYENIIIKLQRENAILKKENKVIKKNCYKNLNNEN